MKKITIREFQQQFHKTIKDVPFVVTSRGIDMYVVTSVKDYQAQPKINVVTLPPKNVVTSPKVLTKTTNVTTSTRLKKSATRKTMGHVPDDKKKSILWEL